MGPRQVARSWSGITLALLIAGMMPSVARPQVQPDLKALEARARADSNDPLFHYDLAMGYWERKRWDAAERELQVAVGIAPSYAEAYLALSELPHARGLRYWKQRIKEVGEDSVKRVFLKSDSYFRRAFLLSPLVDLQVLGKVDLADRPYAIALGRGVVWVVPPWWQKALEKAINDFRDARYDAALQRLQRVIDDPRVGGDDNAPEPILWYHGLAAAHLVKFDVAIRDFAVLTGRSVAVERGEIEGAPPLHTNDYRYALATMLYFGGQVTQAIPTFERVLEFDVGLYQAHAQLARIYSAARIWDLAIRESRAAVETNPEDSSLLVELGSVLLKAGNAAEAEEPLRQAGELNPRDARTPFLLGQALAQLDRPEEAKVAFGRFVTVAPSSFSAQVSEAKTWLENHP